MNGDQFEQPDDELPPPDDDAGDEPSEPIGDVPDDEFGSRVRFSRLKLFAKSAAHYLEHPQGESAALEKGTAVHAVLLGGREIIAWTQKTKPTKKSKGGKQAPRNGAEWEAFRAAHPRAVILLPREYEQINRQVAAVRADRKAMEALEGVKERTILFDMLGLECRSTPDTLAPTHFAELKTCRSSDPFRFGWQVKSLCYHGQMAFHAEAIRRAKLGDGKIGYIVAVESTPPFPVTVFKMTESALEKGAKKIRFWMEQLKGCLASNQWPPYAQSIVDLDVPDEEILFADESPGDSAVPQEFPF